MEVNEKHLTTNYQYFVFKAQMIPWSIGYLTETVFCRRNIGSTHSRFSTWGQTLQLSMISEIFIFSMPIIQSSSWTHSSNYFQDTQLFNWDGYWQGKYLTLLKHFRFCDFPIISIGSLSPNVVRHTLLCIPPEHLWLLKCIVFLDKAWWNKLNLSALKMSFNA